jgi:adenine phosphoribosyltransferase
VSSEAAPDRGTVQETIERLSVSIADYPEPGVVFRDLTPVFADGSGFHQLVQALVEPFAGRFDAVAGVEARGFLLAAAAAYASGTGVVTVRKKGKLPRKVLAEEYALEYGTGTLELHADELAPGARVLVLDDVLATGGTLSAACRLLERAGLHVAGIGVVMELAGLGGRGVLDGRQVASLITV